jgi:deazaflavin-dependent oxidoreductase (nitroreductase family)
MISAIPTNWLAQMDREAAVPETQVMILSKIGSCYHAILVLLSIMNMEGRQEKRRKELMAKHYRVNVFVRINNAMITFLLRLGIQVWSFSLLTVRGRKSGKPIVTPVAIFVQEGSCYLIATYGIVNWVRNLRAAGGEATLTRRRHSEKIHAIELEPESAAPILREAVRSGPPGIPAVIFRGYRSLQVLPYLNVTENSSLEEFEREVLAHPVFLLPLFNRLKAPVIHAWG